jgi:hypothetical protein
MSILSKKTKKKFYTRQEDELIVKMKEEGKTVEEISKATGYTMNSITARVNRVLRNDEFETLDDIKYRRTK